jgi:hypothetical protein
VSIARQGLELGLTAAGLGGVAILGDAVPLDLGFLDVDGRTLLSIVQTLVVLELVQHLRRRLNNNNNNSGGTPPTQGA